MTNLPVGVHSGLTPDQIALAHNYVGHLNIHYLSRARQLFMGGLTCEEIVGKYPEYTLPMLYRACLEYDWTQARLVEAQRLATIAISSAGIGQPKALIFMNRMIEAVYARYEKKLLDFITDPDNAPYPQVSKADFDQIGRSLEYAREMLGMNAKAAQGGGNSGGNLIHITMKGAPAESIDISTAKVEDIVSRLEGKYGKDVK